MSKLSADNFFVRVDQHLKKNVPAGSNAYLAAYFLKKSQPKSSNSLLSIPIKQPCEANTFSLKEFFLQFLTFVSSNANIMHVRKASPTQSYCFLM